MTRTAHLRSACAATVASAAVLAASTLGVGAEPTYPPGEVVVKVEPGIDIAAITAEFDATVLDTVLASRGLYLVEVPFDAEKGWDRKVGEKAAKEIAKLDGVVYAEPNHDADIAEADRFHYWPSGASSFLGDDPTLRTEQVLVGALGLPEIRGLATGKGVVVAVLDTGVDLDHPALAGNLVAGYDYVDDDPDPDDEANGLDDDADGLTDEGLGHGTHAAGLVTLVGPDTKIMPMRVLDSDGRGSIFVTAEAILDAVEAGADVINLSFGVDTDVKSDVLEDALKAAKQAEVVVVAAAGNDASGEEHYPAASKEVLSVGALDADGAQLAEFSNRGKWVYVAAPGTDLISTVPGGYGSWSGTSMAAPVVAGEVALLRELDPDKMRKAKDVVKAVKKATRKLDGTEKGAIDLRLLLPKD